MNRHKVGRFTVAASLILIGLGILWNMYASTHPVRLANYWPAILLLLGGGILWSHRRQQRFSMDALSIVLLTLLIGGVFLTGTSPRHWSLPSRRRVVRKVYWQEQLSLGPEIHTVSIKTLTGEVVSSPAPPMNYP